MPAEVELQYQGKLRCSAAINGSKCSLRTDAPVELGGKGENFSPSDLLAASLGSCIMTIVAMIGQRSDLELAGMRVRVLKDMANGSVRRVGLLEVTITMPKGLRLSPPDRAKFERAVHSCPVKNSLHPDVNVRIKFVYP